MAPLLLFRAPVDEGRSQEIKRVCGRQNRPAGAEILFVEDDLLHKAGAAAAIFFGPGDSDPAGCVHLLLPGDALFQCLAVRRDALVGGVVDADLGRQIFLEPIAEFGTKRRVLGAVCEIHRRRLSLGNSGCWGISAGPAAKSAWPALRQRKARDWLRG